MAAALAPTSPRLPSPPPPAEDQIGPKSPSITANRELQQMEQTAIDANSRRRIHPGTKAADFAAGPPLVPLNELDSAFQLQEHLAALHYHHSANNTQPITRETAAKLTTPPPGIDRTLWLYELCRFLIAQCNSLIVGFLFDTPPCSAATCPEMRASEWQFLCAVHEAPKSCCAIDYCCHTLDWAANIVTNPQIFPSRFVVSENVHDKGTAVKNLVNVFRRLHRIFAHAWFQHRGVFWSVEGQTGLYVFFKTVCDLYELLPQENYKLPPEAEGLEASSAAPAADEKRASSAPFVPTAIARPQRSDADDEHLQPPGRTNTRRHIRSSPSTGSAVTTVIEQDEDDSADVAGKMKNMHISTPETADDESEIAEVPVIVEHVLMDAPQPPSQQSVPDDVSDAAETEREDIPEPATAVPPSSAAEEVQPEPETKPAKPEATETATAAESPDTVSTDAETPVKDTAQTETAEVGGQGSDRTADVEEEEEEDAAPPPPETTTTHDFAVEAPPDAEEEKTQEDKDKDTEKEEQAASGEATPEES